MKKVILFLILAGQPKLSTSLKRKIIAAIGVFFLVALIFVSATAYTVYKAGRYLVAKMPNQEQISIVTQSLSSKPQYVFGILNSVGCRDQIKSILQVNTWVSRPLTENTNKILAACFKTPDDKVKTSNTELRLLDIQT